MSTDTPRPDPREPTVLEIFATLRHKELYGNMALHVFVLVPAATLLAWFAQHLDRDWGWAPTVGLPWNVVICAALWAVGGFVVWYSYGYLYLKGAGSPGSHMGHTTNLVDTGIYSWIRHPSVVGKLIGVIGLGFLMRTLAFLVVFIPILMLYSYVTNILIQERYCVQNLGDAYVRYRKEVPMFVPRIRRFRRFFAERSRK